ncbi:MAG: cytochrome c oxidase subunit 3 family protein [Gammaproteobacteria bacterium]|nr:cytochrome c oxidase subunit 3 family protein [Gammaproteobacteria bacterium]
MWVGLFAEMSEFALMFIVYFITRANYPEVFSAGPETLSTVAGVTNTLIMITSSYCIARAVFAMRADQVKTSFRWLLAALVIGIGYPIVKYFEFSWNMSYGLTGNGDVFQMTYYYLTFNHMIHVFWGLIGLCWVMYSTHLRVYSAKEYSGLEAFACFWHITDLIWLIIFPLFYLL